MKKFAITGGIGSGKSLALSAIKAAGYETLSSDAVVWELYKKHQVKSLLKTLFPEAIKGEKRLSIDKARLAEKAFGDPASHKKLTGAITPLVMEEIERRAKKLSAPLFAEVPLLFECGYEDEFDGVIVILRPLADRIASVKLRSSLTEEQILSRIKRQTDYEKKDFSPYVVITNDGDKEKLSCAAVEAAKKLIGKS